MTCGFDALAFLLASLKAAVAFLLASVEAIRNLQRLQEC